MTFTNDTGRTILVSVQGTQGSGTGHVMGYRNGVIKYAAGSNLSSNMNMGFVMPVYAGETYKVVGIANAYVTQWNEFR